MDLNKLCADERYKDLYILARFMYRMGEPIIDDSTYELVEQMVKCGYNADGSMNDYFNRTYDDDPIPFALLHEFGFSSMIEGTADTELSLQEDKSLSILPLYKVEDVYQYCLEHRHLQLRVSLKVDGANTKSLYKKSLQIVLSRGRRGNSFDWTKNVSRINPAEISLSDEITLFGEAYMEYDSLPILREKYGQDFKTCKSTAISFLRKDRQADDYKYLHCLMFSGAGLPFKYGSENLQYLESQGFEVVPHMVLQPNTIPIDKEEFTEWLYNICDTFATNTRNIPSDGLVFDVDEVEYAEEVKGQYSNRNIAVKLFHWSFESYIAKVKDIIITPKRVECSVRLAIEPIVTKDDCTARIVNGFNPDIIFKEDLHIGSELCFVRDSGAVNKLVRGKLKQIDVS